MNLPNKISVARILLIPFFLYFLICPLDLGFIAGMEITKFISLIIFAVASFTDWIDGHIARKYNLTTNLGKFLDPLADKLLMTAGFVALVELSLIPSWIVIIILSREMAVTGLRTIAASEGIVIAAGYSGKLKTTIQIITIIALILNLHPLLNSIVIWSSLFITLYSGAEYFVQNRTVLKTSK